MAKTDSAKPADKTPSPEATQAISVEGWDCESSHTEAWKAHPPVIASADASPLHLIDWAMGQLRSIDTLMRVIGSSGRNALEWEPHEITGAIRHQTDLVHAVLCAAREKLEARHA